MSDKLNTTDGALIVAPAVGLHRCGTCKHQGTIEDPAFIDPQTGKPIKLCLKYPPKVTPVFQIKQTPQGNQSGVINQVSYPPAPDHWTCFKWKPRFVQNNGDQLR